MASSLILIGISLSASKLSFAQEPHSHQNHLQDEHSHSNASHGGTKRRNRKPTPQEQTMSRLFDLDQEILKVTQNQREVALTLDQQEQRAARLIKAIEDLETKMKARRESLTKALTLRRRLRSARVAEVFLSADGPLALKRREVYLEAIFKSDTAQLVGLQRDQNKAKEQRSVLNSLRKKNEILKRELAQHAERLAKRRSEEWQILSTMYRLNGEEKRFAFSNTQRHLPPTLGVWIDQFQRFSGDYKARLVGAGVWIEGIENAPVYAVEEGRVLFVGPLKGWREVVIIQHAAGFTSVYGSINKAKVRNGQKVNTQQLIGSIGATSRGTQLYFELRRGGQPIHPKRWVEERLLSSDGRVIR